MTVDAAGEHVYVGTFGGNILKIDKQGQFQVFGNIGGDIVGLAILSGTLYVSNGNYAKGCIFQYDLGTLQQIRLWNYADTSSYYGSRMVVTQNQLVVADGYKPKTDNIQSNWSADQTCKLSSDQRQ